MVQGETERERVGVMEAGSEKGTVMEVRVREGRYKVREKRQDER